MVISFIFPLDSLKETNSFENKNLTPLLIKSSLKFLMTVLKTSVPICGFES